ncbi:MAG: carboxymuconolactone decarboxylase family protein [Proteobacteria bacterium]|jgi:AhpD family alkylhydroperoxidase|nr:carboxymuconolactone decarboxylase family protein [Pseudomonadota bacterium]
MNYEEISKDVVANLYKSYGHLKNSPLNQELRILVELLISQTNGCAYCCSLHTNEATKLEISTKKIEEIRNWTISVCFSKAEKLAFSWAEAITILDANHNSIKQELSSYFSDREIVDLALCIALMNALNRIAISLK